MMTQKQTTVTRRNAIAVGMQNISPKVMAMGVLLVVMGLLWGRVLLKGSNSPAAVSAQEQLEALNAAAMQADDDLKVETVVLPIVPGRNDEISNDIFSDENWTAFDISPEPDSGDSTVEVGREVKSEELAHRAKLERIAGALKLEAVVCDSIDQPVQAYVDDKVLTVGSTLTVQEGPDQYVLVVERISEKEISFSWNELSVVLKMTETF